MSVGDPSAHNASGEAGPPADAFAEEVPQADQQPRPPKKERKVYQQIQIPSPEQMMQEEFMNNCATRTVLSGVMGMGLGVLFGIVMGSMDSAVTLKQPPLPPAWAAPPSFPSQPACRDTSCNSSIVDKPPAMHAGRWHGGQHGSWR